MKSDTSTYVNIEENWTTITIDEAKAYSEDDNVEHKAEKIDGKYHSWGPLLETGAPYIIAIGERSNGKTYGGICEVGLTEFFNSGRTLAYIRRFEEDIKSYRARHLYDGVVANGIVKKLSKGKWSNIEYKERTWRLCNKTASQIEWGPIVAYAFSLSSGVHDQSMSYPTIKYIFFDEFLGRKGYLKNEFTDYFVQLISTLKRDKTDVIIMMAGNTVNRYSPYWDEMGLVNVLRQKPGTIDVYKYGDDRLKVALQYCGSRKGKVDKGDFYFAFSNPKLSMVTDGSWELGLYPHKPRDFKKTDVKFTFYIEYGFEMLRCQVVVLEDCSFIYISRKYSGWLYPDKDLIYSPKFTEKPNWRRNITRGTTKLEKKIARYFLLEKVFYQDNAVGDTVHNYLQACKKGTL